MAEKKDLWKNELWTQKEVADYFRSVEGTIIKWRKDGLLPYWQPPGSTKILYLRDGIINFRDNNTVSLNKGGDKPKAEIKRVKPCLSATEKKEWRI